MLILWLRMKFDRLPPSSDSWQPQGIRNIIPFRFIQHWYSIDLLIFSDFRRVSFSSATSSGDCISAVRIIPIKYRCINDLILWKEQLYLIIRLICFDLKKRREEFCSVISIDKENNYCFKVSFAATPIFALFTVFVFGMNRRDIEYIVYIRDRKVISDLTLIFSVITEILSKKGAKSSGTS